MATVFLPPVATVFLPHMYSRSIRWLLFFFLNAFFLSCFAGPAPAAPTVPTAELQRGGGLLPLVAPTPSVAAMVMLVGDPRRRPAPTWSGLLNRWAAHPHRLAYLPRPGLFTSKSAGVGDERERATGDENEGGAGR